MRPYTITAPNGTVLYSPGQDEFSPRQIRPFNSLISMHVIPVKRLNPNTGQTVILNRVIVDAPDEVAQCYFGELELAELMEQAREDVDYLNEKLANLHDYKLQVHSESDLPLPRYVDGSYASWSAVDGIEISAARGNGFLSLNTCNGSCIGIAVEKVDDFIQVLRAAVEHGTGG